MDYNEIIKLLDAGFSREEIMEMKAQPPAEPDPEPTPEPEPEPNSAINEMLGEMRSAFEEMRKEFTAFNIMNSNQPADEKRSSEDIIANIINPTVKKGD